MAIRARSENPDGAESSPECGAALASPGALRQKRKIVTVLFADLVGFTSEAECTDPEEVRTVLRLHARAVSTGPASTRERG
jgi:class 3 adenylate cyclase